MHQLETFSWQRQHLAFVEACFAGVIRASRMLSSKLQTPRSPVTVNMTSHKGRSDARKSEKSFELGHVQRFL